jgi:hypothetical protein
MIVRGRVFGRDKVGKLIGQLIGFVDQHGQALGTDILFLPLEFQGDERSIRFGRAAVQAGVIWHGYP